VTRRQRPTGGGELASMKNRWQVNWLAIDEKKSARMIKEKYDEKTND
jgi:hypothetical protein